MQKRNPLVTHMVERNRDIGTSTSIRAQVFKELDKNPLLTAKPLCKILGLNYKQYGNYLKKVKGEWKCHHINERGSIRCVADDVHCVFFVGELGLPIAKLPLPGGWVLSRSRNRFLLFRCGLGRVRWFETGTVELYVRKPASRGKAMQLFCDAFTKTGLLTDLRVLDDFSKTLRVRGFHAAFNTDQRLPYMKVNLFKETNGFTLILGDRSNPRSAELIVEYQEQVETAKRLIEDLSDLFGLNRKELPSKGKLDYSR